MQWTLVVPLKPLPQAKSRLADTADDGLRPGLALAFAQDTVAAALACPAVRDVVVVTNDALAARELAALGAGTVPDLPRAGLNAALTHAATVVGAARRAASVAALNADLPALRPSELARVLDAAAEFPRSFLADSAGIGTTLLAASRGRELRPQFGAGSRARHRASGAVELPSARSTPYARTWTPAGICGPPWRWASVPARPWPPRGCPRASSRLTHMQATAYTYDPDSRSGQVLLDDGTPVPFDAAAFDAGGLRLLRPGQRVRLETEGEGASLRITLVTLQTL